MRVYYEVHGDSPDTVCLLPPWAISHSRAWRATLPYLARHFRVITIDPRGNGRSDRPQHLAAYSRAAHVSGRDRGAGRDGHRPGDDRRRQSACGASAGAGERAPGPRASGRCSSRHSSGSRRASRGPFTSGERERYEGMGKFNPAYWRQDFRGFVEWFARWTAPHPHSTRQIEVLRRGRAGDRRRDADPGLRGLRHVQARRGARSGARNPVPGAGDPERRPRDVPQAHQRPAGRGHAAGRLHVFEGLGPLVGARWPVAMNLVLREFLESVRARDTARQQGGRVKEPTRARFPDESGYVERDGVRVYWESFGEGDADHPAAPPWSIVHSRIWKAQVPYLARHHRVVSSTGAATAARIAPATPRPTGRDQFVEDARAVLDATEHRPGRGGRRLVRRPDRAAADRGRAARGGRGVHRPRVPTCASHGRSGRSSASASRCLPTRAGRSTT